MELEGKSALITGGARIGRTLAEALARRGVAVSMIYRNSKGPVENTIQRVESLGVRGVALRADLSLEEDCGRAVEAAAKALGGLDFLINMASLYERTPLGALDQAAWEKNMTANLSPVYHLSLKAAPHMKRRGSGRIVNFSDWISASGRPRYKDYIPYYVSKTGVIGLTEALALELAPDILVNAVAPGPILAPGNMSPEEEAEVRRATPLGRWGGAEEIAKAAIFLLETDFITGECLRVDGGRHLY